MLHQHYKKACKIWQDNAAIIAWFICGSHSNITLCPPWLPRKFTSQMPFGSNCAQAVARPSTPAASFLFHKPLILPPFASSTLSFLLSSLHTLSDFFSLGLTLCVSKAKRGERDLLSAGSALWEGERGWGKIGARERDVREWALAAVKQRAGAKRRNAALHYESHRIYCRSSSVWKIKKERQNLGDKIHHPPGFHCNTS